MRILVLQYGVAVTQGLFHGGALFVAKASLRRETACETFKARADLVGVEHRLMRKFAHGEPAIVRVVHEPFGRERVERRARGRA